MNNTKQTTAVSLQLTHKYARHWRELNQSHYLGDAEISDRLSGQPDEYGSHNTILRLKFIPFKDKKYREANVIRALEDTFTFGGCDHEHDCCGCASGNATATRWPDSDDYMVIQEISYNY